MNERDKEFALKASNPKGWLDRQKFADFIRADEREACAKVCEDMNSLMSPEIAKAIRARGTHENQYSS
jgi:hypothetical protein